MANVINTGTGKTPSRSNYSQYEKELVLTLVSERPIIFDKETKRCKTEAKEEAWADIMNVFNSDPRTRVIDDWKKLRTLHKNLRRIAGKESAFVRRQAMKTGGGEFKNVEMSGLSQRLQAMEPSNYSPIPGSIDTEAATFSHDDAVNAEELNSTDTDTSADYVILTAINVDDQCQKSSPTVSQAENIPCSTPRKQAFGSLENRDETGIPSVSKNAPVPSKRQRMDVLLCEGERRNELYALQKVKLEKKIELLKKKICLADLKLQKEQS